MIDGLKGKTLHGAEILDVSYGREEVPEAIQNMGRKLGHEPNTSTGLWFQASCKVKGKTYLAEVVGLLVWTGWAFFWESQKESEEQKGGSPWNRR